MQRERQKQAARSSYMAATKAAATLVACAYHERDRLLRYQAFKAWHAPVSNDTSQKKREDNIPRPSLDDSVVNVYHCRHDHSREHNHRCGGKVEMSIRERKSLGNHGVVCAMCAQYCGCGRLGCGNDPGARNQLCRVVDGEVVVDESWCKEQRRWAAMEEEEAEHDDDDDW